MVVCALLLACAQPALAGDMPFPAAPPITTHGYIQTGISPTLNSTGDVPEPPDETATRLVEAVGAPFTEVVWNWLHTIFPY
jgi:hypothetical protein